jgi:hypothetical protein
MGLRKNDCVQAVLTCVYLGTARLPTGDRLAKVALSTGGDEEIMLLVPLGNIIQNRDAGARKNMRPTRRNRE